MLRGCFSQLALSIARRSATAIFQQASSVPGTLIIVRIYGSLLFFLPSGLLPASAASHLCWRALQLRLQNNSKQLGF